MKKPPPALLRVGGDLACVLLSRARCGSPLVLRRAAGGVSGYASPPLRIRAAR